MASKKSKFAGRKLKGRSGELPNNPNRSPGTRTPRPIPPAGRGPAGGGPNPDPPGRRGRGPRGEGPPGRRPRNGDQVGGPIIVDDGGLMGGNGRRPPSREALDRMVTGAVGPFRDGLGALQGRFPRSSPPVPPSMRPRGAPSYRKPEVGG